MKAISSNALWKLLVLTCVLFASTVARAELNASVDRDRVTMGDTVRLTITATANEAINNIDLRPLLQDFEILQRSSSSSTNIINGVRTNTRQVIVDISPKREGTVRIPALQVGRDQTNYLLLAVGPSKTAAGDPLISFEAELDSDEVYVQGQAILTLRIQQAVNLDSRSITELQLDNAFVKPLEQKSFQRTIAGRPWLVHEIRYAIFPEQSGTIEIPVQTFSARESQARRSLFDMGNSGRQVKRSTEALRLSVLPRPAQFPAPTWLPARKLEIAESWSTPPEQLRVGESATRRITITGEGLQGAQLPPVQFPATTGLKYYPDQPAINDSEVASGLVGTRVDSAALVPTRQGSWEIPQVRIPWWDTQAGRVRYAVLPARTVLVAAALDDAAPLNIPVPSLAAPSFDSTPIAVAADSRQGDGFPWMIVAAISSIGWILTLAYLFLRRPVVAVKISQELENPGEAAAFKQLLAACATGNTRQARQRLIQWAAALIPGQNLHSLDQLETRFADPQLNSELKKINDSLYSPQGEAWDGAPLAMLAKRLRKDHSAASSGGEPELQLYPQ
jgi:hypothetical protein